VHVYRVGRSGGVCCRKWSSNITTIASTWRQSECSTYDNVPRVIESILMAAKTASGSYFSVMSMFRSSALCSQPVRCSEERLPCTLGYNHCHLSTRRLARYIQKSEYLINVFYLSVVCGPACPVELVFMCSILMNCSFNIYL